jgi:hypothetical protein
MAFLAFFTVGTETGKPLWLLHFKVIGQAEAKRVRGQQADMVRLSIP